MGWTIDRIIFEGSPVLVSFDMVSQKWNLLLDARDDDDLYLIIYYAVYMFADEDLSTYHEYQLTYQAVWVCDEEIETDQAWYTETNSDEWDEVIVED